MADMVSRRRLLKIGGVVGLPVAFGVGVRLYPFRPTLYDVRVDSRREEPVELALRLDADGSTVYESTIMVPPDDILHLPCEWPRALWSYEMRARPAEEEEWQSITWNNRQRLCKKIVINESGHPEGPISYFESGRCPTTLGGHSCG